MAETLDDIMLALEQPLTKEELFKNDVEMLQRLGEQERAANPSLDLNLQLLGNTTGFDESRSGLLDTIQRQVESGGQAPPTVNNVINPSRLTNDQTLPKALFDFATSIPRFGRNI